MKFLTLLIITLFSIPAAGQNGYIQVISEPEITVFLNGLLKGKTSLEMRGLIIENVNSGKHTIKVIKEGFLPQESIISLKPGEVFTYTVKPFQPQIKITQKGNRKNEEIELKTGTLKVQSLPIEIKINVQKLGVNMSKTEDEWIASDVPEGNYRVVYSWGSKILTDSFRIKTKELTHYFVNMYKGTIEDLSPSVQLISADGRENVGLLWILAPTVEGAKVGDVVELIFSAKINQNWSLYSNEFNCTDGPVKTSIQFKHDNTFQLIDGISAIDPEKYFDKVFECETMVFRNVSEFTPIFKQKIKITNYPPKINGDIEGQLVDYENGIVVPFSYSFKVKY